VASPPWNGFRNVKSVSPEAAAKPFHPHILP